MRPQHITAENEPIRTGAIPRFRASMRPQHITAENVGGQTEKLSHLFASMRPQHITAENPNDGVRWRHYWVVASMRPQHITAENMQPRAVSQRSSSCFNEAAAYHCGKPSPKEEDMNHDWKLQ